MKKTKKKVLLTLDESLYFLLKGEADKLHLPVASYIRANLAKTIKEDNIDGK